jgi:hypothetical protein
VRLKAGFVRSDSGYAIHGKRVFPETAGDVQEDDLKLGKTKDRTESIEEGLLHEIDGKVVQGKIPTLQGNYYD